MLNSWINFKNRICQTKCKLDFLQWEWRLFFVIYIKDATDPFIVYLMNIQYYLEFDHHKRALWSVLHLQGSAII